MSNIAITSKAVAYSDKTTSNNPLKKNWDWSRVVTATVRNPKSYEEEIPAGSSATFFSGSVATGADGTTAWSVTRNSSDASRYRFTATAGTAPALRTDRGLTLNGQTLTVTADADGTATMTLGGGTWGSVVAGDTVFLPGPTTGDAATVVNVLNEGFWTVLAVLSSTAIQVQRPAGEDFQGAAETVTLASNAQVQAWSATGVQAGDSVEISAGFVAATQRTFTIDRLAPSWFEVVSSAAVPLETGKIPGASGMLFYTSAKKFVRVEADQEVSVRLNGDSGDHVRVSPVDPSDADQTGWFEIWGAIWALTVVNKSSQPATVTVFSAE